LGISTFDAMFLTLSLEGASSQVFTNQSIKMKMKKLVLKKTQDYNQ
jgi:hypothetical protein